MPALWQAALAVAADSVTCTRPDRIATVRDRLVFRRPWQPVDRVCVKVLAAYFDRPSL